MSSAATEMSDDDEERRAQLMKYDIWTFAETAWWLRTKEQTLYGWNKFGTGPRYAKPGKHCLYRRDDVVAWLEAHMVDGPPPPEPRRPR